MKFLCSFFIAFGSFYSYGQSISLIDKAFKKPILFTDSISVEQIKNGYFPIKTTDLDTFAANIKYLSEMLKIRQRAKMESFELRAGKSIMKINRIPYAYGDRFNGEVRSKFNDIEAVMLLLDHTISNKENNKKLQKMLDYLLSNKSLFNKPYEVHPKLYNVVVITQ